jgi:predicted transcriptional regulator
MRNKVIYKTVNLNGVKIFYRESGNKNHPTILLFHGFPASSHMYRNLIEELADEYHIIAPDFPGFGNSDQPHPKEFEYTFDNLANVMNDFIENSKIITPLNMKYRSRTEIVSMILEAANGGATKTRIMYKAFLSYAQLKEYLSVLIENNLIEYLEGIQTYKTTEKGLNLLKMHNEIGELLQTPIRESRIQ